MHLDHLIYITADLEAAARAVRERFGFASVPGGVHPGGTRNVVIPLEPPQYLELLGVDDAEGDNGRLLAAYLAAEGDQLVQWAVRVDEIKAVADRLGIEPEAGSIAAADGSVATWRTVSHPDPESRLPFFIQYDDGGREERVRRRFDAAGHAVAPGRIVRVDVGGDEAEVQAWLGANELPIAFVGGPAGIAATTIATPAGTISIEKRLR